MILVQINGGLGNQLFQYAAAKSLSIHHNVPLYLDLSYYKETNKDYDLKYFHVTDEIANNTLIHKFSSQSVFTRGLQRSKPPYKRKVYREPFFHFDENFFDSNKNVFLKGVRQSEKYFSHYEKSIRNVLKIKHEHIEKLIPIANQIKNENSISVHIRRGDYLTPVALKVLGLTTKEYYNAAIEYFINQENNPTVYFFSDDIEWVKRNINIPFKHDFVSGSISKNHIEDFFLMSQCRHNIIANSTFSWWGAWLNDNPQKIVIAPKKWFNEGPKDIQDLIPEGWIKL
jgi:Glycosyl transferase family 11